MAKIGRGRLLTAALILSVIFLPPFIKYQRLLYKKRSLEAKIRAAKEESRRLKEEEARLRKDIVYIESKAREKMGVVRKGEIVLKDAPQKPAKK
jgi:cell division protein FtsB